MPLTWPPISLVFSFLFLLSGLRKSLLLTNLHMASTGQVRYCDYFLKSGAIIVISMGTLFFSTQNLVMIRQRFECPFKRSLLFQSKSDFYTFTLSPTVKRKELSFRIFFLLNYSFKIPLPAYRINTLPRHNVRQKRIKIARIIISCY